MLSALQMLELKINALKNSDGVHADNQALQAQVSQLQSQVATLKQAGEETLKDLDLALGQIADLSGGDHG